MVPPLVGFWLKEKMITTIHANNFNQGGVLHSTVAFGYLSHPRVSLLCPDSATQEGVNMATVCVLLLFKMHYYHLLWCTCVQLASSSSGVSFLESVARWAGRTLELLKLRRGSHFDTMHTADQDLCYGVFHPNIMWAMQQVPDQSFKKTCNSRNFNNWQSDKIRAIACNIGGTPTSIGCKK